MPFEHPDGATLLLHASETLASMAAAERPREQLVDVLANQVPTGVTVDCLGSKPAASFAAVCALLRSAADAAGRDASYISICIDATILEPKCAWETRCTVLGRGTLNLLVGSLLTPPAHCAAARIRQDQFWAQCWQLRESKLLRTVLAPTISSPCPLLAAELADSVLPPFGLQVPAGTAWVQMPLNIVSFADEQGVVDMTALRLCLQRYLEQGERRHDRTDWPMAATRHDAWLNRRLAILLSGIGDLARLRGYDAGCFHSLQRLSKVLQEVREVVVATSRQLAIQTQPAPVLAMHDTSRSADWQARWHKALEFAAMRHRNLLAMSPWAVFPSAANADSRYCDLLPLLEYADACAFPAPPGWQGWNINKFKQFHHRVSAVLGKRDARQLIAEQV